MTAEIVNHKVETDEDLLPARDMIVAPGQILKRELDALGLAQKDLATIMGRPVQLVSEVVSATKQVTPQTAIELAEAIGPSPEFWLALETNYRLDLARHKAVNPAIAARARMFSLAPIAELVKRRWIRGGAELEGDLCGFLGIPTIWDEPTVPASLRASMDRGPEMRSVAAWIRRVEVLARPATVAAFDAGALRSALPEIAALSMDPTAVTTIPQRLADLGVAFVIVPHLPKTYLDGGAVWLDGRPAVALTLRYDRIDSFYFSLLHELAHVVLGHTDAVAETVNGDQTESAAERAANELAGDALVPREASGAVAALIKSGSLSGLEGLARSLGRHPAVVVGRLHHDGLSYNRGRTHLVKVNAYLTPLLDRAAA